MEQEQNDIETHLYCIPGSYDAMIPIFKTVFENCENIELINLCIHEVESITAIDEEFRIKYFEQGTIKAMLNCLMKQTQADGRWLHIIVDLLENKKTRKKFMKMDEYKKISISRYNGRSFKDVCNQIREWKRIRE